MESWPDLETRREGSRPLKNMLRGRAGIKILAGVGSGIRSAGTIFLETPDFSRMFQTHAPFCREGSGGPRRGKKQEAFVQISQYNRGRPAQGSTK